VTINKKLQKKHKSQISVFVNTLVIGQKVTKKYSASPITNSMKSGKFAGHKHTCQTPGNIWQNSFDFDKFYHCKKNWKD